MTLGRLDNRNKYELGEARDSEAVRLSYYVEPSDNLDVTLVFDNIEANDTGYTGTNYTNPIYNLANPYDLDGRRVPHPTVANHRTMSTIGGLSWN